MTAAAAPIEICFIHADRRVQAHMQATAEQFALLRRFENARSSLDPPQAFQVFPLDLEASAGTAVALVKAITDAIGLEFREEEDQAQWTLVQTLAVQLDGLAQVHEGNPLTVEFIWDNGGNDDNVFTQSFVFPVDLPEGEALLARFHGALENASGGDFYDLAIHEGDTALSCSELRSLVAGLDEEDAPGLKALLEQVAALEAPEDPALPRPPRKSPKP